MTSLGTRTITALSVALLLISAAPPGEAANKVVFITSVTGRTE